MDLAVLPCLSARKGAIGEHKAAGTARFFEAFFVNRVLLLTNAWYDSKIKKDIRENLRNAQINTKNVVKKEGFLL